MDDLDVPLCPACDALTRMEPAGEEFIGWRCVDCGYVDAVQVEVLPNSDS